MPDHSGWANSVRSFGPADTSLVLKIRAVSVAVIGWVSPAVSLSDALTSASLGTVTLAMAPLAANGASAGSLRPMTSAW